MGEKIDAAMPDDIVIGDGYIIVFAAVHPTTGADVTGVNVTDANVTADDQSGGSVVVGNPILIGVNT